MTAADTLDTLDLMLAQLDGVPLLTADEERELFARIAAGDSAARERVVRANLRLVVSIAKRYLGRGLDFPDLIQEGTLGLMTAIGRFDLARGNKFSTYATWWIEQGVSRALHNQTRAIRLPVHMGERLSTIRRAANRLTLALGREPTIDETAAAVGLAPHLVRQALTAAAAVQSLDAPMASGRDGDPLRLMDTIAAAPRDDDAAVLHAELRRQINAALDQLDPRERAILQRRFGLAGHEPHTLEAAGREFGITRERARQLEADALRRLRSSAAGVHLRGYLAALDGQESDGV